MLAEAALQAPSGQQLLVVINTGSKPCQEREESSGS